MTCRIAIVGLGAAARTIHLPALSEIPGVVIVGGSDPAASARDFPFPLHATLQDLHRESHPDVVVVATPPETHFELCREALEAGCHVMCEKPFVETLAQADELAARAAAAGRRLAVNNQYRFMRIHEAAKRLLSGPELGDLLFLAARQTFVRTEATEAGWRGADPRRTCKEFGTHVIDLCRFFFDEEPRSLRARMPRGGDASGQDLLVLLELEFSRDRVAQITLDRLAKGPHRYLDLQIDGTRGSIECRIGGSAEIAFGIRGGSRRPFLRLDVAGGGQARLHHDGRTRRIATDPVDLFAAATRKLYARFLASIADGSEPPCSAADNRKTLALMLAAYESDRRGAPIAVSEMTA